MHDDVMQQNALTDSSNAGIINDTKQQPEVTCFDLFTGYRRNQLLIWKSAARGVRLNRPHGACARNARRIVWAALRKVKERYFDHAKAEGRVNNVRRRQSELQYMHRPTHVSRRAYESGTCQSLATSRFKFWTR